MKISDLKIGDVIFRVSETSNSLSRKKIHKIIDGVDWFRYNSNVREYELTEVVLCGVIMKDAQGELPHDLTYEKENEYYVKNSKGNIYELDDFVLDNKDDTFHISSYYTNKDDAIRVMNKKHEQARQVDLSGTEGE